MNHWRSLSFLLLTLTLQSYAHASEIRGKITFVAVGKPAMIKIRGESETLAGKYETSGDKANGQFHLRLDDLKTGIDLRDKHMKEKYLETAHYPNAELNFKDIQLKDFKKEGSAPARLKLHGVEKPIQANLTLTPNGAAYKGSARFEIKLSDYQITIPSYAGIKVADTVEVQVDFDAQ